MDKHIRIMTFNIWMDGKSGGLPLSQTAEVIRQAEADVVGMQEVKQNAQQIAGMLGWQYVQLGGDTAVLSRYEIVATTPEKRGAQLRLENGQPFFLCNVHLAHAPYQPYQLLNIPYGDFPFLTTEEEAIAAAKAARDHQVAAILRDIRDVPDDMPVFITGDFNEPSHLDWTEAAARAGRHPIKVNYPSTRTLERAGFVDAYRRVHPDEMSEPGYTWPTVAAAQENDREDRIDFVLFRGRGVTVQAVEIAGAEPRYASIVVTPYPSDHRAVVATFSLAADYA